MYQPLLRLLYNIGFIGCLQSRNDVATYGYDEPAYADRVGNLQTVFAFTVHPAFRPAPDMAD